MGKIVCTFGFGFNEEIETDIWDDVIKEKGPYYGEILKSNQYFDQSDSPSGDVRITNQLSIVGNDFLFKNLEKIRYILYKNERRLITIEESYPRIIVRLGGIYNGPTPTDE